MSELFLFQDDDSLEDVDVDERDVLLEIQEEDASSRTLVERISSDSISVKSSSSHKRRKVSVESFSSGPSTPSSARTSRSSANKLHHSASAKQLTCHEPEEQQVDPAVRATSGKPLRGTFAASWGVYALSLVQLQAMMASFEMGAVEAVFEEQRRRHRELQTQVAETMTTDERSLAAMPEEIRFKNTLGDWQERIWDAALCQLGGILPVGPLVPLPPPPPPPQPTPPLNVDEADEEEVEDQPGPNPLQQFLDALADFEAGRFAVDDDDDDEAGEQEAPDQASLADRSDVVHVSSRLNTLDLTTNDGEIIAGEAVTDVYVVNMKRVGEKDPDGLPANVPKNLLRQRNGQKCYGISSPLGEYSALGWCVADVVSQVFATRPFTTRARFFTSFPSYGIFFSGLGCQSASS